MALRCLSTLTRRITKACSYRSQVLQSKYISSSTSRLGLEEFFPPGALESNEPLPESVKTGRRWRANELRTKSFSDLHKLWFVLLKERNMLLTVMWEARRQGVPMPSPGRLYKVRKSMAMIKVVIGEREQAVRAVEQMQWDFDKEHNTEIYRRNMSASTEDEEESNDYLGEVNAQSTASKHNPQVDNVISS